MAFAHGLTSFVPTMPLRSQPTFGRKAFALTMLVSTALPACTDQRTEPVYSRSMVEPVMVEKRSDSEISVRYKVHPESSHYSGGVDFKRVGDVLRIVIGRCAVGSKCEPMAKSVIPLDDSWQAEVRLPYDGGRVVVMHTDGETQIHP